MSTVILGCSSLKDHVEFVQGELGTAFPAVWLDQVHHRDPAEMRECAVRALGELDDGVDTVLVVMGACGGTWDGVRAPRRLVLPRVDDCISLLLTTSDEPVFDRKTPGHLYVKDKDPGKECFRWIFERLTEGLDRETVRRYHEDWKGLYHEIDVIDTGLNGCRRPEYLAAVRADADWLDAGMDVVPGGVRILRKLLAGDWDEQFLVVEPGEQVVF